MEAVKKVANIVEIIRDRLRFKPLIKNATYKDDKTQYRPGRASIDDKRQAVHQKIKKP